MRGGKDKTKESKSELYTYIYIHLPGVSVRCQLKSVAPSVCLDSRELFLDSELDCDYKCNFFGVQSKKQNNPASGRNS